MSAHRNPVGWFEIYVQDIERAKAFYQKTFEVALEQLPGTELEIWAFPMQVESPGCAGAIVKMEGKDSGGGGVIIYFSCGDCSVQARRAEQNGGRVIREKFSIGQYGFISLVEDTEENLIGLYSME